MDAVSKNVGKDKLSKKMQSTTTQSTKMQTKYFEEKTITGWILSWNVLECPGMSWKRQPSWKSPGILANVLECPGKSPLTYT